MKELSLSEQQSFGLELLKDVDSFCRENGIHYSLAYGSLIGAVRHGGFIPWDDDIDIIMPRPDYVRFCREYVSSRFFVLSRELSGDVTISFARVCDNKKTTCITLSPWCKQEVGIWIDVFPLDGVSDSFSIFSKQFNSLKKEWRKNLLRRFSRNPLNAINGTMERVKLLLKKIITFNGYRLDCSLSVYDGLIKSIPFGSTDHCCQLTCLDGIPQREWLDVSDFADWVDLSFNSINAMVMKGYKNVLSILYDDYMQLPPLEERIPHNNIITKFYWK